MLACQWRGLLADELKRGKRRATMIAVGLVVGVGALVYFLALGAGMGDFVDRKLMRDLPAEEIMVSLPETDLGPLRLKRGGLFGSRHEITDETVMKLKALEIEHRGKTIRPVKNVWRRMDAAFPASISGNLFGVSYGSDTAISGVDYGMVAGDVPEDRFVYDSDARYVPVLIPNALLEVYNTAFADAQGLPGMSPSFLIGKNFTLHLGSSSVGTGSGHMLDEAVIAGLTDRGTLLGVTVPIEYVREWNRRIGRGGAAEKYSALVIEAADASMIPAIAKAVRDMGLRARAGTGLAERVSAIVSMITLGLALLAGVILTVAGLNAWSLFRLSSVERRHMAGLWMALGASPSNVQSLLLAEAVAIGAISGVGGSVLALVACVVTNRAAVEMARSIPIFPVHPALFNPLHAFAAIGLTVLIALVAAWPSARKLARTDPAEILASGG